MKLYLVTGGGGFIGSHVVRGLLQREQRVRVLDNFLTGKRENLAEVASSIELMEGDIRDEKTMEAAVREVSYIIHLGALPSVPRSVENPLLTTDINVNGTVCVLNAARRHGVKRVVFASSSSVYGDSPEFPRVETQTPGPLSPYAVSKLAGEYYHVCFYKLYGLETICLRFFNVFGPRQDPTSQYSAVIPKFITAALQDRPPIVHGDGEQTRDFTFVSDVVEAVYKACHAPAAAGEILNVACARRTSLNRLLELLSDLSGKKIVPEHTAPRPGDVRDSLAQISKAEKLLDYRPSVSMAEGLVQTYKWYLSQTQSK